MAAADYGLYTGDVQMLSALWSDDDNAIHGASVNYNSLQFSSGLRYFNTTTRGMLHFPANCGGSWACDALVDWPTTTRDGYDCTTANAEDTVRSSYGAIAFDSLASIATWLGKTDAATRYSAARDSVRAALRSTVLRTNGTMAYFVDGANGAPNRHAAVHSTLYAVAAGAADGNATLAAALTAYLVHHGVPPSSCMMGRWWVSSLLRLGVQYAPAADAALAVLTSATYPSWLDMLAQGATTTMEAWRPTDKSNLDWAHPWCASPSFTIPAGVLGVTPLEPGWARFQLAPQPGSLTRVAAVVPTLLGVISVNYTSTQGTATVAFVVLSGQRARVCLASSSAVVAAPTSEAAIDTLTIDGTAVATVAWGRFLCATDDVSASGPHVAVRSPTS